MTTIRKSNTVETNGANKEPCSPLAIFFNLTRALIVVGQPLLGGRRVAANRHFLRSSLGPRTTRIPLVLCYSTHPVTRFHMKKPCPPATRFPPNRPSTRVLNALVATIHLPFLSNFDRMKNNFKTVPVDSPARSHVPLCIHTFPRIIDDAIPTFFIFIFQTHGTRNMRFQSIINTFGNNTKRGFCKSVKVSAETLFAKILLMETYLVCA